MTTRQALEVVASGTGIAIVPMSVARLLHRKDLTHRPVTDVPPTRVGLAWPTDVEDPDLDAFVGVVRGRTARSSRGPGDGSDRQAGGEGPAKAEQKSGQKSGQRSGQKSVAPRGGPRPGARGRAGRSSKRGSSRRRRG
jgi:hypothetical protein